MSTMAEFTYLISWKAENPRDSIDYLLEMVARHEVEVDVNYLSSGVRGKPDVLFELPREVYETMVIGSELFRFHIELLSSEPGAEPENPPIER